MTHTDISNFVRWPRIPEEAIEACAAERWNFGLEDPAELWDGKLRAGFSREQQACWNSASLTLSAAQRRGCVGADALLAQLTDAGREPVAFFSNGRALVEAWAGDEACRFRKVWTAETIAKAAAGALDPESVDSGDGE